MISRSSVARLAIRPARCTRDIQRRAFASGAPSPSSYQTHDAAGIKIASRDGLGPTATIALVAKAGTRYQPLPGLTAGLEEFAFKNTTSRSALRITRESELLGGQLTSYHNREALFLQASFLRDDIPYFTELLAEVMSHTKYTTHEFHEDVERVIHLKQAVLGSNAAAVALDAAHAVAFHTGLGAAMYPTPSAPKSYLDEHGIAAFAEASYNKANIAIVADGASQATVAKWVGQFFEDTPTSYSGSLKTNLASSTYYGGEQRSELSGRNAMVIAFPSSGSPEFAVLANLLGGPSSVKWSPGSSILGKISGSTGAVASATNLEYSDAGLLAIQVSGSAAAVRKSAEEVVKALKGVAEGSVSKEDVSKAVAKAKFDALEKGQLRGSSVNFVGSSLVHGGNQVQAEEIAKDLQSVTPEKVKSAAKALLEGKATVSTVGDLHALPYAADIGLNV